MVDGIGVGEIELKLFLSFLFGWAAYLIAADKDGILILSISIYGIHWRLGGSGLSLVVSTWYHCVYWLSDKLFRGIFIYS